MGFHIVKRDNCPLWKKAMLYAGAVVLALLMGAVLLLLGFLLIGRSFGAKTMAVRPFRARAVGSRRSMAL